MARPRVAFHMCAARSARFLLLAAFLAPGCGSGEPAVEAPDPDAAVVDSSSPGGGPVLHLERDTASAPEAPGSRLAALVGDAAPGTEIRLSEGQFVLDNPLLLSTSGILLRGAGSGTVLRPRHPAKPLIVVAADRVGLEDLVLDAGAVAGDGRALFGVEYRGCLGCRLSGVTIVGTGGTAVWGTSVRDFHAEGNRILDAGNDAFFLHGRNIRITNNVAVRFLDEAVDISIGDPDGSRDVIVDDNCFASGRIAIAVTADHPVVADNVLEDGVLQALYLEATDSRGVVTGNRVNAVGRIGLALVRPSLVSGNRVVHAGVTGIRIQEMREGIVQGNRVAEAGVGLHLIDVSGSLVHLNRYVGERTNHVRAEGGEGNVFRHNQVEPTRAPFRRTVDDGRDGREAASRSGLSAGEDVFAAYSVYRGACFRRLTTRERGLLRRSLAGRTSRVESVEADTERGQRIAAALLEVWNENNPGVRTLQIDEDVMTTEITPELLATLRAGGMQQIGIVRYPVMLFRGWRDSYEVEWRLTVGGKHVGTVAPTPDGPSAKITFQPVAAAALSSPGPRIR